MSLLYTLLANEPHADIFSDLADAKWKDMRKLIINCIIHTDMVHHFPMVSKVSPGVRLDVSKNICTLTSSCLSYTSTSVAAGLSVKVIGRKHSISK